MKHIISIKCTGIFEITEDDDINNITIVERFGKQYRECRGNCDLMIDANGGFYINKEGQITFPPPEDDDEDVKTLQDLNNRIKEELEKEKDPDHCFHVSYLASCKVCDDESPIIVTFSDGTTTTDEKEAWEVLKTFHNIT